MMNLTNKADDDAERMVDTLKSDWNENSSFSKEIHRIIIRCLTFKTVLHNKHDYFYAPVAPGG